jgi:hypothetical protein
MRWIGDRENEILGAGIEKDVLGPPARAERKYRTRRLEPVRAGSQTRDNQSTGQRKHGPMSERLEIRRMTDRRAPRDGRLLRSWRTD